MHGLVDNECDTWGVPSVVVSNVTDPEEHDTRWSIGNGDNMSCVTNSRGWIACYEHGAMLAPSIVCASHYPGGPIGHGCGVPRVYTSG